MLIIPGSIVNIIAGEKEGGLHGHDNLHFDIE